MFFTPICADNGEADGIIMICYDFYHYFHYYHYSHYYHPNHDVSYNRNESQVIVMECKNLKKMDVGGLSGKSHYSQPNNNNYILYRVSKKTEFCQIKHLQILLVIGEKYLSLFVTNPVKQSSLE